MAAKRSFSFLSPLTKLVTFFQRSRDKWKEKCKAAKRQNKSLKVCLNKMKQSRDRWKACAIALEKGGANEGLGSPGGPKQSRGPGERGCPAGLVRGEAGGFHHQGPPAPVPLGGGGRQSGLGTLHWDAPQTGRRGTGLDLELVGRRRGG